MVYGFYIGVLYVVRANDKQACRVQTPISLNDIFFVAGRKQRAFHVFHVYAEKFGGRAHLRRADIGVCIHAVFQVFDKGYPLGGMLFAHVYI